MTVTRLASGTIAELHSGGVKARMRVARTGLYRYRTSTGQERIEYRSPEALLAIAPSLQDAAIVLGHPKERITASNRRALQHGHVSNVEPQLETHAGHQWLVATGVFTDQAAIDALARKSLGGLSLGLDCTGEFGPAGTTAAGEQYHASQQHLIANHLALLPPDEPRAGPECRVLLDSGNEPYPSESLPIMLLPADLSAALVQIGTLQTEIAQLKADKAKADADLGAVTARADSTAVELAKAQGELKTATERNDALDPEKLAEDLLAFRVKIAPGLPKGYEFAGKNTHQVRLDSAKHLGGTYSADATDAVLDAFISGRLAGAVRLDSSNAPTGPQTGEQIRAGIRAKMLAGQK